MGFVAHVEETRSASRIYIVKPQGRRFCVGPVMDICERNGCSSLFCNRIGRLGKCILEVTCLI
jgi:hypothetical protein